MTKVDIFLRKSKSSGFFWQMFAKKNLKTKVKLG